MEIYEPYLEEDVANKLYDEILHGLKTRAVPKTPKKTENKSKTENRVKTETKSGKTKKRQTKIPLGTK